MILKDLKMIHESICDMIKNISPAKKYILPSKWSTDKRSIDKAFTKHPGKFQWDWSPYFKEPLDCLAPDSPIELAAMLKPVQIGVTQTVIEPIIGYTIDVFPRSMGYSSADKGMSESNFETRITSMFESANIQHRIKPLTQTKRNQKSGDLSSRKEYEGGTCHIVGAHNPNQFRQFSAPILLGDEVDAWPYDTKHG